MPKRLSKSIINILQHYATVIIIVVFLVTGSVSALLVWQNMSLAKAERHEEIEHALGTVKRQLNESIKSSYSAMLSLALIIDNEGIAKNFDSLAAEILRVNTGVDALEIVPNGVIKYVYPLKGNESVLNYNILESEAPLVAKEAFKAIESKKVHFAGPIRLKQGYNAVIGRMPIFKKGQFWGFTAVIIRQQSLLKNSGILSLDSNNFQIRLTKLDLESMEETLIYGELELDDDLDSKTTLFSEGDWKLTIAAKRSNAENRFQLFLILVGISTTSFITVLFYLVLKRSNRAFKRLYKELNIHLHNSPLGIVEYDKDLNITKWSAQCEDIFGWTEEEILKSNINAIDIIYDEDQDNALQLGGELQEGLVDGNVSGNRNYTKSGKIIDCIWYNSIFRDEDGNVTSIMSLVKDITDQKQKERELAKREADLSLIFDSTTDLMFLIDTNNESPKYLFANWSFEKITGLDATKVIGKSFGDILRWEKRDYVLSELDKAINEKEKVEIESFLEIGGDELCFSIFFVPIIDKGAVEQVLAVCRDITTRKNNEKVLGKTIELTKAQNARLINFAYIVSHNLRSHTSNISGILSLLDSSQTDEERAKLVSYLKTVALSLDDTMSHLNEVVNIQTNLNLTTERLNLYEYIENTKVVISNSISKTSAEIQNNVDPEVFVVFNKSYLESVLLNFLSNAIKYKKEQISPVIKLQSFNQDGFTVLEISDNGSGIDLEKHGKNIFGLYKRFHKSGEGKGLGLFITKNQIEALGGKVDVESEVGKGTTFSVWFEER